MLLPQQVFVAHVRVSILADDAAESCVPFISDVGPETFV